MSTTMHRLQISIPQWEKQFLEERAKRDGVSVAEVIRQLIQREAEVNREGTDTLWKIEGIFEDTKPLMKGIPVSKNVDLYINADLHRRKVLRERPGRYARHGKTKKQ